jgi:cytochrome c-type biogenesis protein CcmE
MKTNKYQQKRIIFVVVIFLVSFLGLLLIINNFRENLVFFYSPKEVIDQEIILKKINNKIIRVGGLVKENSLKKIDALTIEFVITDYHKDLTIYHKGIVPDLFRDKQGVIAKGYYDQQQKKFYSQELLVKHDENYIPAELKNIK